MSHHVIEDDRLRWIFGWDQYNRSFFFTKHDKSLTDNENPVFQVGVHPLEIPHPDGLFALASMVGLDIPQPVKGQLQRDQELEQREYYVLFYPGEFINGFRTDSMAYAETLKDALAPVRPDQELQIRRVQQKA